MSKIRTYVIGVGMTKVSKITSNFYFQCQGQKHLHKVKSILDSTIFETFH